MDHRSGRHVTTKFADVRAIRFGFAYQAYAAAITRAGGWGPADVEAEDAYASRLKAEVQPLVESGEIQTHRRNAYEDGGPGVEFDLVTLLVATATALGAYSGVKEVARDVQRALRRLATLSDGRVYVDQTTAEVLAVDAVATEETFSDIEIVRTSPLLGPEEFGESERGYLVELSVNGTPQSVVVTTGGAIIGATGGTRPLMARPAGVDAPAPEDHRSWVPPEDATENGGWVEDDEGEWSWVEPDGPESPES
jgi:hypothetical protein